MSHVFISYLRDDSVVVDRLVKELSDRGIQVWIDREKIMPGERWELAIRRAIEGGAHFLACFSSAYERRTRSYVHEELTLAIEELRQRPSDRTWFIPALLEKCEVPDRPIGAGETLRSIQWVDLTENWDRGVERLCRAIQAIDKRQGAVSLAKGHENDTKENQPSPGKPYLLSSPIAASHLKGSPRDSTQPITPQQLGRPGAESLANAAAGLAITEAQDKTAEERSRMRYNQANAACYQLHEYRDALYARAQAVAPGAMVESAGSSADREVLFLSRALLLGRAKLWLHIDFPHISSLDRNYVMRLGYELEFKGWDVLATATSELEQAHPTKTYWSLLWYGRKQGDDGFRWWEAFYSDKSDKTSRGNKKYRGADVSKQIGMPPTSDHFKPISAVQPIDGEYFDQFCDTWLGLLARAAEGRL